MKDTAKNTKSEIGFLIEQAKTGNLESVEFKGRTYYKIPENNKAEFEAVVASEGRKYGVVGINFDCLPTSGVKGYYFSHKEQGVE